MRKRLVAGNWKMFGSREKNRALLAGILAGFPTDGETDCAVCVPFPYLSQAAEHLRGSLVSWGAQDVSAHAEGAFTGEVSAAMLADFGCRYAIVGHSERRQYHAEDDALVAAKFGAARGAGLIPVLCVGETLAERDGGLTERTVLRQLEAVIDRAGASAFASAVLAYEPVWAIGTGRNATPEQAQEVHALLRRCVAARDADVARGLRILYGGSVKAANAAALFAMPDVDGGLVGGASLVADEFLSILRAAAAARR
jgi:triosephosphate isomerase